MVVNLELALNVITSLQKNVTLQEGLHCDLEPDYFNFMLDSGSNIVKGLVALKTNENRSL